MKRDICDELYNIALKRYKEEFPDREMTSDLSDKIWYSIYGVLAHNGEAEARKYVETAKLW